MRNNLLKKHLGLCALPLFLAVCMPMNASAAVNESTGIEGIQQNGRTVTVTVRDALGEVIGANVLVKGTTIGGITNMDGVAVIQGVPNNATIQVSFVGYVTQEIALQNGQNSVTVTLREDSETLEEVVVVGYGTQAKKDITGSVAVVSRDAIAEQPVATFAEALQGRAAGVYVSGSGAPGAGTTIRIRGVGGVNGSSPLIIVDGIQGVDVSSVNPNDIESFQVLKDAAATAIYGARAANGVIIVTTKQGTKESKVNVSYNGYIGASTMPNKGYDLLTGWDFMLFEEEGFKNQIKYKGSDVNDLVHDQFGSLVDAAGNVTPDGHLTMPYTTVPMAQSVDQIAARFGVTSYDPNTTAGRAPVLQALKDNYQATKSGAYTLSAYYYNMDVLGQSEQEARKGTDWYDLVTRTGLVTNHEISLQGGGTKGMYATSVGYNSTEGPIKASKFERYSVRMNATYNPTKHFTVGLNNNMSLNNTQGERGGQGDGSTFGQTYTTKSWQSPYNVSGDFAGTQGNAGRNTPPHVTVALAKYNLSRNIRINTAAFVEIKDPWIKGLSLRSQFSVNVNGGWSRSISWRSITWNKEGSEQNSYSESANWGFSWQWTNTATYKTTIAENHDLTVVAGTEALKNGIGYSLSAARNGYAFERIENTWQINNGNSSTSTNSGSMNGRNNMFGLFGRVDYSYQGKYLVTATIRRDASSRFSESNRWGTFPSVSLGWRISDEPFMAKAHETWLDDLKLRVGYGTTGNSNIDNYNYAFTYGTGNGYVYGIDGSDKTANTGYGLSKLGDSNAKWETSKMFNVGYDLTAFNNKLTSSFDFYIKKTSDMLVPAPWSYQTGLASRPYANVGEMKNTGIDFSIGWRDQIGQLRYNISANASWYKNEVVKLGASDIFYGSRLTDITITTPGQPIGMFYGYVVDGIYQSDSDVSSYGVIPYGANPDKWKTSDYIGRYKFKDLNGDGLINQNDREIIGNPHPDLTGGVNISLNWKEWDLSTYLYYSIGNDNFAHFRYYTHFGNLGSTYSYDRRDNSWSPTNTSGKWPMWIGSAAEATESGNVSNSMYIEDGSFLRMQTLTLGYTLPRKIVQKLTLSRIRLYAQMSNVFTITGYTGLDPETGRVGSDMNKGVDYGAYGMPRQYIFGVNIGF
jgi:TonB-linked SusC/RagA family outer membrane protein